MSEEHFCELITSADKIALVIHEAPDGDSIASSLALAFALRQLNKQVDVICRDEIPEPFHFLPDWDKIVHDLILGDYDAVMLLDCGDLRRSGFPGRISQFAAMHKQVVNIDHHPKNDLHHIATINLVDYNASSTAEIVHRLINLLGVPLDSSIATCLLTGLYTDTGGFRHINTMPQALELAALWLKAGARLNRITSNIRMSRTTAGLRLLGLALQRLQFNQKYQAVISAVSQRDLLDVGATARDIGGIVNYLNLLADGKVAIMLAQVDDSTIRASVRSHNDSVDIVALATLLGGNGQKEASGFMIDGRIIVTDNSWEIEYVQ